MVRWIRQERKRLTESPLKIVQIVSPTTAGGLERVVESLALGHHERGHDVTVAALLLRSTSAHPFVKSLKTGGVNVVEIRTGNRAYLEERREVSQLLRELHPNVVHTHGYRRDILHRPVAARLGLPTVTTVHGRDKRGGLKGAFFEWLQRRTFRRFDAVVAVSSALKDEVLADGVAEHRLHCIPNAWGGYRRVEPLSHSAARRALELDPGASVVGWVGRMIPVKGGDILLQALGRIPEAERPVGALIGYGPEADSLRGMADELGLLPWVRFYPDIRDAERYFAAFDTYVLSSRSEGLPIVILEAMATGTPIVATRVGGVPEALEEEHAWLVPPEDPAALAIAVSESLRDRSAASDRARRASRRLQTHFGLDAFLDRYERVYRAVCSHPC